MKGRGVRGTETQFTRDQKYLIIDYAYDHMII